MGVQFSVLGPLTVNLEDGGTITRPSHRRMLAILLLNAGVEHGFDTLIQAFWGEDAPPTAKAALQTHISALRRLLPGGVIRTARRGYVVDLDGHELDADIFLSRADTVLAAHASGSWLSVVEGADRALEMWRGRPFMELDGDDFARPAIARLEESRLAVLEARFEAKIELGQETDVLGDLEAAVLEFPLRERLWSALMTARYRLGRHAEAVRAYREAAAALGEVGLEPSPELRALEHSILVHAEGLSFQRTRDFPSPVSRFVGRERELSAAGARLESARLLTVCGVGGAGKTRLAVELAMRMIDRFPDGSWFVDFASVRSSEGVAPELATSIGLMRPGGDVTGELSAALGGSRALIVMDNCEHVREAVAGTVQRLLERTRNLRILSTSRIPLGIPGEEVFQVPPMGLPHSTAEGARDIGAAEAVELFVERAAEVRSDFRLDDDNARDIAAICERLDGNPLAIELAATKAAAFSPATIRTRLSQRFDLLESANPAAPIRHRSVPDTVKWSHQFLNENQRVLFRRLSVFDGGFRLEAAEEVCDIAPLEGPRIAMLLESLVRNSLVAATGFGTEMRYRMLEIVRDTAAAFLEDAGELELVRERHAAWCLGLSRSIADREYTPERLAAVAAAAPEYTNLEAALAFEVGRPDEARVAELAGAMAWIAREAGWWSREIEFLRTALESGESGAEGEGRLRARLSQVLIAVGRFDEGAREIAAAAHAVEGTPDSAARVVIEMSRAYAFRVRAGARTKKGVIHSRRAVEMARRIRNPLLEWESTLGLAVVLAYSGEHDESLDLVASAMDLAASFQGPDFLLHNYTLMLEIAYLHPTARRNRPLEVAREMTPLIDQTPGLERHWDTWLMYVWIQAGLWGDAERSIQMAMSAHREGIRGVLMHMVVGTLRWMQGDLDTAAREVAAARRKGIHQRWHHDFYPLAADIAADRGDLHQVRRLAEEHLAFEVDPSEESMKLGTLHPLVRAEVEAALGAGHAEDHVRRAEAVVAEMHDVLRRHPPDSEGTVALETAATHLAFAEAELSRATAPAPRLWEQAAARADYIYFRVYAQLRLAEALHTEGRRDEASALEDSVAADVGRLGARRLERLLAGIGEKRSS